MQLYLDTAAVREIVATPAASRRHGLRLPRSYVAANLDVSQLRLPQLTGPFDFGVVMRCLCQDICQRMPEFRHIDMDRVLVTVVRCRNKSPWGIQAKLTPLRFRGGAETEVRRRHRYRIQEMYVGATRQSYLLSFYLPRFLNQSFTEKFTTIFHELFHIHPDFTGDIRRFEGNAWMHTRSQAEYDRQMADLARAYLAKHPDRLLYDFLQLDFEHLRQRYGAVTGLVVQIPKLIPVGDGE